MKKYTDAELKEILQKHWKWLKDEEGGEQANLRSANLRYANLSSANLRSANLSSADLRYANLRYANLSSANLDFSCFPLWCGGSKFKCEAKFVYQLLAHIATLDCADEDFKEIKKLIMPYALKSHRANDLGLK